MARSVVFVHLHILKPWLLSSVLFLPLLLGDAFSVTPLFLQRAARAQRSHPWMSNDPFGKFRSMLGGDDRDGRDVGISISGKRREHLEFLETTQNFVDLSTAAKTSYAEPLSYISRIRFMQGACAVPAIVVTTLGRAPKAFAANGILAQQSTSTGALYGTVGKIDEYLGTLKATMSAISGEEAPSVKRKILARALDRAASPMLDAMLLNELSFDLSEEDLQRGASLPIGVKEHIGQLSQLIQHDESFARGGKLYKELEDVINDTGEYIKLSQAIPGDK